MPSQDKQHTNFVPLVKFLLHSPYFVRVR